MITTLKKGGLTGIIVSLLLLVIVAVIPIFNISTFSFDLDAINTPVLKYGVPLLMIASQVIWFQRVIHQSRFFEQWSYLPAIVYIFVMLVTPGQLTALNTLALNYIWLIFYQKLFYQNDDVISNAQVFMDMGILMCIGAFIYPKSIYLLPFLYVLLNQFTASDLNKFFIVLLSFFMVAFSTVGIGYFFVSPEWVTQIPKSLTLGVHVPSCLEPGSLYTYITLFTLVMILIPVVYNQLSFMQTKNRSVINLLFLKIVVVLAIAIFSGKQVYSSMQMLALPLAFILSFGLSHIQKRWLANLGVLFVLFALVLIQWVYVR
ncbi:MAG: hypothetical protein ACI8SE_000779 [Bacteroidia bacterium]